MNKPWRNEGYRRLVASKPCLGCGIIGCQAHHCRDLVDTGASTKPGDQFCIPLCPECHTVEQAYHNIIGLRVKLSFIHETFNEFMANEAYVCRRGIYKDWKVRR